MADSSRVTNNVNLYQRMCLKGISKFPSVGKAVGILFDLEVIQNTRREVEKFIRTSALLYLAKSTQSQPSQVLVVV